METIISNFRDIPIFLQVIIFIAIFCCYIVLFYFLRKFFFFGSILSIRLGKDYKSQLEYYNSKLAKGLLNFVPPNKMKVGKNEIVEAIILKAEDFEKILQKDVTDFKSVSVGSVMKVILFGDSFLINAFSNDTQVILKNVESKWIWSITPQKKGIQTLILQVSVKVKLHGFLDEHIYQSLYTRKVFVNANYLYVCKRFIKRNWQWIITTAIGSGIIVTILKVLKIIN